MVKDGIVIQVLEARGVRTNFHRASHVTYGAGGTLLIWNIEGKLARAYSPSGWHQHKEVHPEIEQELRKEY